MLPPLPQRAPDYLPMRMTPSGTGSLLMASFVFNMIPAALAWVSPAAAAAFSRHMWASPLRLCIRGGVPERLIGGVVASGKFWQAMLKYYTPCTLQLSRLPFARGTF